MNLQTWWACVMFNCFNRKCKGYVFNDAVKGTYINLIDYADKVTTFFLNGDVHVKPYNQDGVIAYDKQGRVVAFQGTVKAWTVERIEDEEDIKTPYVVN